MEMMHKCELDPKLSSPTKGQNKLNILNPRSPTTKLVFFITIPQVKNYVFNDTWMHSKNIIILKFQLVQMTATNKSPLIT
jgi:hypothetical protein